MFQSQQDVGKSLPDETGQAFSDQMFHSALTRLFLTRKFIMSNFAMAFFISGPRVWLLTA